MSTQELDLTFGKRSPEAQLAADTDALMFRFLSIVDRIMEERGISKRALADAIGTSPAFISQLFRGHKIVNLETLAKMQKALAIEFEIGYNRTFELGLGMKSYEVREESVYHQAAEPKPDWNP